MSQKTISQIMNEVKSGSVPSQEECLQTMCALHSMFIQSRMEIEAIAAKIDNKDDLYFTVRSLLGDFDFVKCQKDEWLNAIPEDWIIQQKVKG